MQRVTRLYYIKGQKSTTIANVSHIGKSISLYINIPSRVKFKLVSSDLEQICNQMKNRPIKNHFAVNINRPIPILLRSFAIRLGCFGLHKLEDSNPIEKNSYKVGENQQQNTYLAFFLLNRVGAVNPYNAQDCLPFESNTQ